MAVASLWIRFAAQASALLILAAAALPAFPVSGQEPSSDLAVKAGFLTKFAGYVTWPAQAQPASGAPFSICLIGIDPFGKHIDVAVRGQRVEGHPVEVLRMSETAPPAPCQIAFVQGSTAAETNALLQKLADRPILTVTDAGSAPGMIQFEVDDGRIRFRIDEAAARASGLTINSRLLAIASGVNRGP